MSRPRTTTWVAAAATVALAVTPQASATHLPGFGHDNNVASPGGTGTICNTDDGCLIAHNDNAGSSAHGVIGRHTATLGTGAGVFGETKSIANGAIGVYGLVAPAIGGAQSAGVKGENNTPDLNSVGVLGISAGGTGVRGFHTGTSYGNGVIGLSSSTVSGTAGVRGLAFGEFADTAGVYGEHFSNAANAAGVRGHNANSNCCGMGVFGSHAGQGIGVYGEAPNGFAVSGFSPNNWSGYFQGSVRVVGTLIKSSGAFRIDHPLDPAHKYLQHSFVESPEMMNVYNGNVITDGHGFATVKLPAWFQAMNRDFRYQLTPLGHNAWGARAVVWDEIHNNRFTIRSEPRVKISWQVTGVRHDAYANAHRIQTVVPKTGSADGKYVHPELYGKPMTKSVVVLPGMTHPAK